MTSGSLELAAGPSSSSSRRPRSRRARAARTCWSHASPVASGSRRRGRRSDARRPRVQPVRAARRGDASTALARAVRRSLRAIPSAPAHRSRQARLVDRRSLPRGAAGRGSRVGPGPPLAPGAVGTALGALRGACARRPGSGPTTTTTSRQPRGSPAIARAWPLRASSSSAATTPCADAARRPCSPHDRRSARAALIHADATAAGSRHAPAATITWTAFIDRAAAPRHGTPHQPSCRRCAVTSQRGPR